MCANVSTKAFFNLCVQYSPHLHDTKIFGFLKLNLTLYISNLQPRLKIILFKLSVIKYLCKFRLKF